METLAASERFRVRRAQCLIAYWKGDSFVLENYLSRRYVQTQPLLAQLVHSLSDFEAVGQVRQRLAEFGDGEKLLSQLINADVLVKEGSAIDSKDSDVANWPWGHDARYFHFATRDVDYTFDVSAVREHFEKKAKSDPPPSPFKVYPGSRLVLPRPAGRMRGRFWTILKTRRTVRAFQRTPISREALSTILHSTWGKLRYFNDSVLDRRIIKTSPSGGARHPIEVYPIVQRVKSIRPGIYHYSVSEHALEPIRLGRFERRVEDLYAGQSWVRDAAACFVMTAILPRSMWKYDHSRAYRVVQLDAGHLGQTLHLVATALGLGPFTTAAIRDSAIENELGIDGVWEVPVYAGAVGIPSDQ